LALGATADQIARIHAPIGLDIGAASPAEIAVAVLAQAIQAFRSRGLEASASAQRSESILEKHDA
ncbi:XdhC family protein, partial [Mesorhizobium sp.]